MADNGTELQLLRTLEERLARRRAVETAIRTGQQRDAHRDALLLRDNIAEPVLRRALQIMGLYSRGVRNALEPAIRDVLFEFEIFRRASMASAYCTWRTCTSTVWTDLPRSWRSASPLSRLICA